MASQALHFAYLTNYLMRNLCVDKFNMGFFFLFLSLFFYFGNLTRAGKKYVNVIAIRRCYLDLVGQCACFWGPNTRTHTHMYISITHVCMNVQKVMANGLINPLVWLQ